MLQEVEEYIPMEDRPAKTPKPRRKKASPTIPTSPLIELPPLDFPDLPSAPSKARPIPPSQPSPIRRTTKRRTKKVKDPQEEIIEPPTTVSQAGRVRKRGLFHDELLANLRAN
jgi:hypothetical protein